MPKKIQYLKEDKIYVKTVVNQFGDLKNEYKKNLWLRLSFNFQRSFQRCLGTDDLVEINPELEGNTPGGGTVNLFL